MRNLEPVNDMLLEKINDVLGCYQLHGTRLHPLGKVMCDGQNILVAFTGWRINFADHVHAPASKRPRFDDRVHY
jgi:hypothetical protein